MEPTFVAKRMFCAESAPDAASNNIIFNKVLEKKIEGGGEGEIKLPLSRFHPG